MEILVVYDVATDTLEGQRRLRHVAHICEGYGQRVQKSVFECVLDPGQLEQLLARLAQEIDHEADSIRVYRLREPRGQFLRTLGIEPSFDLRDTLLF